MMKKLFRAFGILSVLVLPAFVLAQSTESAGFVSLTKIPSLQFVGNETQLPVFLNSIYKICIGLAAVLGVLQIMRAGLTWMTAGGSHEKIGEARGLIRDAILGLLLVLAPTIVFSIINPDILSLRIGKLDQLALPNGGAAATANRILWQDETSTIGSAITKCAQQGGYVVTSCRKTGSTTAEPMQQGETCEGTFVNTCMQPSGAPPPAGSCDAYKNGTIQCQNAGTVCDGGKGFTRIDSSCCSTAGSVACGSMTPTYSPANPPPSVIPATEFSTREPNASCTTRYPSGTNIPWDDNQAAQCCEYQEGATVTCTLTRSIDSQTQRCTCSSK